MNMRSDYVLDALRSEFAYVALIAKWFEVCIHW